MRCSCVKRCEEKSLCALLWEILSDFQKRNLFNRVRSKRPKYSRAISACEAMNVPAKKDRIGGRLSHHSLNTCYLSGTGGCGWGGRVDVQPEGGQFNPQSSPKKKKKNLHAEVSLSNMLNPELCLIWQQSAANICTIWMCVTGWM